MVKYRNDNVYCYEVYDNFDNIVKPKENDFIKSISGILYSFYFISGIFSFMPRHIQPE